METTRLVFVCNPNNPTGTAVRRAELVTFLDAVPASTLVVLDEAYREFVTDPDVPDGLELMRGRPTVGRSLVLRDLLGRYVLPLLLVRAVGLGLLLGRLLLGSLRRLVAHRVPPSAKLPRTSVCSAALANSNPSP